MFHLAIWRSARAAGCAVRLAVVQLSGRCLTREGARASSFAREPAAGAASTLGRRKRFLLPNNAYPASHRQADPSRAITGLAMRRLACYATQCLDQPGLS